MPLSDMYQKCFGMFQINSNFPLSSVVLSSRVKKLKNHLDVRQNNSFYTDESFYIVLKNILFNECIIAKKKSSQKSPSVTGFKIFQLCVYIWAPQRYRYDISFVNISVFYQN